MYIGKKGGGGIDSLIILNDIQKKGNSGEVRIQKHNIHIGDICFLCYKVLITWPSEHYSEFEADWLKKRCFSQQAREKLQRELFFPGNLVMVFDVI